MSMLAGRSQETRLKIMNERVTPRDQIIGAVATKVAPAFGLTPTAIVLGLTTAIGIATTVHQNVTRFDKGYDTAVEHLREGGIKLENETLEIKTEADREAIEAWQSVIDEQDAYEATDDAAVESLTGQVAYWKERFKRVDLERKNDPQSPIWNDTILPEHERVRFDNLNRERDSDGSADARASINNSPELVGYPAPTKP